MLFSFNFHNNFHNNFEMFALILPLIGSSKMVVLHSPFDPNLHESVSVCVCVCICVCVCVCNIKPPPLKYSDSVLDLFSDHLLDSHSH